MQQFPAGASVDTLALDALTGDVLAVDRIENPLYEIDMDP